jgi:hypothetical protein
MPHLMMTHVSTRVCRPHARAAAAEQAAGGGRDHPGLAGNARPLPVMNPRANHSRTKATDTNLELLEKNVRIGQLLGYEASRDLDGRIDRVLPVF